MVICGVMLSDEIECKCYSTELLHYVFKFQLKHHFFRSRFASICMYVYTILRVNSAS